MEYGELSERMENLFAEQVSDNAILTDALFCRREAGLSDQAEFEYGQSSEEKTALIGRFKFTLLYVRSRRLRYDQTLLLDLGIKNPNAVTYYEYWSPNSPYVRYISGETWQRLRPEVRRCTKTAPFFNYFAANPKAKSLAVNLRGIDRISQRFQIAPNLSPFCANHFVLWPEFEGRTGLKQVYYTDMLYWIDDLFCQLESGYSLFFSAKGSGNSVDSFHAQVLRLPFPAFDCLDRYYEATGLIMTNVQAWPLPGMLLRYGSGTKDAALAEFDRHIRSWLSLDNTRTFNLLFRKMADGIREAFFIFRKKGFTRLSGVSNEFAACEAGGNIVIENREEYEGFPGEIERFELVNGTGQPVQRRMEGVCLAK
jgi:hypothetical protein